MKLTSWIDRITGDKRRWRDYKARSRELPAGYRTTIEAVERYLMHVGPADGSGGVTMFEDLLELFELAAANGTPIRDVVGEAPVEFIETFAQNYPEGQWRLRERTRLTQAIDQAVTDQERSTS